MTGRREFDGRPFVAGGLTGIRAFKIDTDAMLTGVIFPQRFELGVNEAVCQQSGMSGFMVRQLLEAMAGGRRRPHQLAGLGCECGFYAYFKGRNSYIGQAQVAGIVEGQGVCTVGSRGFRAEKVRLVALIQPKRRRLLRARAAWSWYLRQVRELVRPPLHQLPHRVATGLRRVTWKPIRPRPQRAAAWINDHCDRTTNILQNLVGLTVAVGSLHFLDGVDSWFLWLLGLSIMWSSGKPTAQTRTPALAPAEFARVRGNYPDVPVYRTRREAIRAHPLTPPDRPGRAT